MQCENRSKVITSNVNEVIHHVILIVINKYQNEQSDIPDGLLELDHSAKRVTNNSDIILLSNSHVNDNT